MYPGHPSGLPQDLRPPSNSPPPPTATQVARNDCATPTCTTNSGIRTKGNANCIDKTCKTCCIETAVEARRMGISRGRCAPHGQPEIMALGSGMLHNFLHCSYVSYSISLASIGPPPTQPSQPLNHMLTQDPPTITTPNAAKPTTPGPTLSLLHVDASTPGHASASPALNQDDTISNSRVPAVTLPRQPNIRSLAQPLAPGWGRLYEQANQEKLLTKNLKIQNHELDEQRKRTCTLVLYHTVSFSYCCIISHLCIIGTERRASTSPRCIYSYIPLLCHVIREEASSRP